MPGMFEDPKVVEKEQTNGTARRRWGQTGNEE